MPNNSIYTRWHDDQTLLSNIHSVGTRFVFAWWSEPLNRVEREREWLKQNKHIHKTHPNGLRLKYSTEWMLQFDTDNAFDFVLNENRKITATALFHFNFFASVLLVVYKLVMEEYYLHQMPCLPWCSFLVSSKIERAVTVMVEHRYWFDVGFGLNDNFIRIDGNVPDQTSSPFPNDKSRRWHSFELRRANAHSSTLLFIIFQWIAVRWQQTKTIETNIWLRGCASAA